MPCWGSKQIKLNDKFFMYLSIQFLFLFIIIIALLYEVNNDNSVPRNSLIRGKIKNMMEVYIRDECGIRNIHGTDTHLTS